MPDSYNMSDVFLSYSRRDVDFVKKLFTDMKEQGKEVWADFEDIPVASDWWNEIRAGIDAADAFVVLRDASGRSSGPVALAEATACFVSLPAELVGLRGVMTIWRRLDGQRERTPWLVLRSRVRSNATVPIAGLAKGRYDFEMVFGDAVDQYFAARDAAVPGIVTLQAAP